MRMRDFVLCLSVMVMWRGRPRLRGLHLRDTSLTS
jgi:hypothetical protein